MLTRYFCSIATIIIIAYSFGIGSALNIPHVANKFSYAKRVVYTQHKVGLMPTWLQNQNAYKNPRRNDGTISKLDKARFPENDWFALKSSTTSSDQSSDIQLDAKQLDFAMGYLNKHHPDLLVSFVSAFSPLGSTQAKKNAFSGGSYKISSAKLVNIDLSPKRNELTLDVAVKIRNEPNEKNERVSIPLDANPVREMGRECKTLPPIPPPPLDTKRKPIDSFIRQINRLCIMVKHQSVTGKLIRLGIQIGGNGEGNDSMDDNNNRPIGYLKKDMFLNQVPHNRFVRKYFYDMASKAALDAVIQCSNHQISNRMLMTCLFPELNTSMDSYRIGTLLEMIRSIAITLAEQNLRIRICVQGSMGVGIFTGLPKSLSGVSKLLQMMDWQAGEGEINEGMLGNYVNFGEIGPDHVVNAHTTTVLKVNEDSGKEERVQVQVHQDDIFLLICPQSMIGIESSIIQSLEEMVEAVGDRPIILLNPDLTDKRSAQGQQSVRGRKQRIEFANSFKSIFHFQCIYYSGTSYFPILGAVAKLGPSEPWVAFQRRDLVGNDDVTSSSGEMYVPCLSSESKPESEDILQTFEF